MPENNTVSTTIFLGEVSMKLRLRIIKKETHNHNRSQYRFAVIDLEKSKQYPQNFVCILPKTIKIQPKPANNFESIFGNESKEVAIQLLKKTLRKRPDVTIRKAIRERLKQLTNQPIIKGKCETCGRPFETNKKRCRKYKLCQECYRKKYAIT